MENIFDDERTYVLGDQELEIIGDREKLAQWRYKKTGPAYYRLGRKIVYRGSDLNSWVEQQRVEPPGFVFTDQNSSNLNATSRGRRPIALGSANSERANHGL